MPWRNTEVLSGYSEQYRNVRINFSLYRCTDNDISYNISSISSIREDFGGNPCQRFLCNTAEGDSAVKGNGGGVLQRAQGEAFLQPAGGIHVSVSVSPRAATGLGQSGRSRPALIPVAAASFISTFNSNLSSLESRQPRASG